MKVCALASGSSGNCFYVENEVNGKNKGFLIDAGISAKQISMRLNSIARSPENVNAILLTHEHSDHIKGVDVFARKFNIPIFATKKTLDSRFICQNKELFNNIKNNETLKLADLEVNAFSKSHLSGDPVSFSIINKNKKLSVMTDIGFACNNVIEEISSSDFLCIESNYDEKMLEEGFYPWPTKKWIKSDQGHLSNTQSASAVLEHSKNRLKQIMLCHISQNNNTPQIAKSTYEVLLRHRLDLKPILTISERHSPTDLFKV
jgi:phosphoribosyl 1,2-cyclic phosphodiesterase